MKDSLYKWWDENKKTFLFCIVTVFVIGLAAHAFQFLNFQFSHDSLDGLYVRGRENMHKVELGRMFSPVYRYIFGGNFSAPWLIGFLGLLWVGIAAFFVVKILDIKSRPTAALVCGVMAVNITVTSLAGTFMHDFDVNMFALMLACLAVFGWKYRVLKWVWFVAGAVALCLSLGLYQSYISVAIVLIMVVLIKKLVENKPLKELSADVIGGGAMGLAGGVLYYIAVKVAPIITGKKMADRWNSVTGVKELELAQIPDLVVDAYKRWFKYFVEFSSNWTSPKLIAAFNLTVMAVLVCLVAVVVIKKKIPLLYKLAVMVIVALLPLGMNIFRVLAPGGYHGLMTYAFVLLYIAVLALAEQLEIKPAKAIACICTAAVVFSMVQASNEYYLKKNLNYQATYARMAFVLHDMQLAGFDTTGEGNGTVFISGAAALDDYSEFDRLDTMRAAAEDNSITSDNKSIEYYFKYVLGCPVYFCSGENIVAIRESEEFINMPVYPHEGYIKYINDIMVVKLE